MIKEHLDELDAGGLLGWTGARRVRGSIARLVHMAMDRPGLAAAARALSQRMQAPREGTQRAVPNVMKYLRRHPLCQFALLADIIAEKNKIIARSDSDWATDSQGRRSVSGGVVLLGLVPIGLWSKTQGSIACHQGRQSQ